jgi:membrane associated rhomboid family serine protease
MDWGLALESRGIGAVIERDADGWRLVVEAGEAARARREILEYRRENRRFAWRRMLPGGTTGFHRGALAWVAALGCVFLFQGGLLEAGRFDTAAVRQGQLWRAVTATWLHADVAHLAGNLVSGGLTLGLAMGRFGPGTALLGTLLAGAGANLLALAARGTDYVGLGASGVAMAALGMLAGHAVAWWRVSRHATRPVLTSLGAAVFLFLVLGVDPRSDVAAHFAGFVLGLAAGAAATWLRPAGRGLPSGVAYLALVLGTWAAALSASSR